MKMKTDYITFWDESAGPWRLKFYPYAAAQRCVKPAKFGLALLGTSAPMPVTDVLLSAAADDDHAAIDMANTSAIVLPRKRTSMTSGR